MIDANGKHVPNIHCWVCTHRHPATWTCAKAAEIAQLGRPRVSALPRPDAVALLTDLVNALNATNWSSWQSTAKFDPALRAANTYLGGLPQ